MDDANLIPINDASSAETLGRGGAPEFRPSPHWHVLSDELHVLTSVVPDASSKMERTTVLTWLYRNEGFATFQGLSERLIPEHGETQTDKKRGLRRLLRNMAKINLVQMYLKSQHHDSIDIEKVVGGDARCSDDDGSIEVGSMTAIHLAAGGMTWLRRAYRARYLGIKGMKSKLKSVHQMHLEEEEEVKSTELYWLEALGGQDGSRPSNAPNGKISSWMGPRVTSVFDLPQVVAGRGAGGGRIKK